MRVPPLPAVPAPAAPAPAVCAAGAAVGSELWPCGARSPVGSAAASLERQTRIGFKKIFFKSV